MSVLTVEKSSRDGPTEKWTAQSFLTRRYTIKPSPQARALDTAILLSENLPQLEAHILENICGVNLNSLIPVSAVRSTGGRKLPLELASKLGNIAMVKMLIRYNADPNAVGSDTPLISSILYNRLEIAKHLIEKGANTCQKDSEGKSPLAWAVIIGNYDMIQLMLDNGAEFTIQSALTEAYKKRDPHILELLMKNSPIQDFSFLNVPDESGDTILLKSVRMQNFPMVKFLVAQECVNLNYKNAANETALGLALKNSDFRTFKVLVSKGADVQLASAAIEETARKNPEFAAYIKTTELYKGNEIILQVQEEHQNDKINE